MPLSNIKQLSCFPPITLRKFVEHGPIICGVVASDKVV